MSISITVHCDRQECPTALEVEQSDVPGALYEAGTFGWAVSVRPGKPTRTICPEHVTSPMPRGRNEWSAASV